MELVRIFCGTSTVKGEKNCAKPEDTFSSLVSLLLTLRPPPPTHQTHSISFIIILPTRIKFFHHVRTIGSTEKD